MIMMANFKDIYKKKLVTKEHALLLLYQMIVIRRFEEKSAEMYTKEKIRGFLHLCVGEEAVAVGIMQALTIEDTILATYREHGHALARGIDAKVIMAEMYGKTQGCCRGRGGSMHLFDVTKNFYGGNAIVASHLPVALGMALASKKKNKKNIVKAVEGVIRRKGIEHELPNIKCPTLVMVGDQDKATVPAKAEFIHQHIPQSILVYIINAGHSSSIEEPEQVNKAMDDFLRDLT